MKFTEMGIRSESLHALERMGLTHPTEIQKKTVPLLMEGRDMIGQSETGSGKTLAFAIPILETLIPGRGVQALILTPTRELAKQIKGEFDKFGQARIRTGTIYGGVGFEPQIRDLLEADVIVATPGRMLDHIRRGNAHLEKVAFLVLDEADRMLEMGFIEDVEAIIRRVPPRRQTMLFSATIPFEISRLAQRYLKDPVEVKTQRFVSEHALKQVYFDCMDNEKFSLLVHLIKSDPPARGMVFCPRRHIVDAVARSLAAQGIRARALHGGLTQAKREHTLSEFHGGRIHILVATDVASRGLHIEGVTHIYNYSIPENADDYTHRIGRTARAGKTGKAVSLVSPSDYDNFRKITVAIDVGKEQPGWFQRIPLRLHERREERRPVHRRHFRGRRY